VQNNSPDCFAGLVSEKDEKGRTVLSVLPRKAVAFLTHLPVFEGKGVPSSAEDVQRTAVLWKPAAFEKAGETFNLGLLYAGYFHAV